MAIGTITPSNNIVHFYLLLRQEAIEAHIVDRAKNHLLSMNMLQAAGYLSKFIKDISRFYNVHSKQRIGPW